LHITFIDMAAISQTVLMLHTTLEHVGYGLDPAVGVPGKAGQVILWAVCPEIIKHQERIEERQFIVTERPVKPDTGPFNCRVCRKDSGNSPYLWHI
jgi:hypothetical protein